ncbi:MAG: ABC-type nitrate/sulfonate/bicarbonate transport system permease component [Gammaproteobacteria bacterium]
MRRSSTLIRSVLLISAVLLLELLCQQGVISRLQLTAPSRMVTTLVDLMGTDIFWDHALKTIRNIFIAIILAAVMGFLIGLLLYRLPRLRRAMEPVIASYYALPFFVLYPLAIVIVGMNDISIIVMGFAYALVAMITSTLSGLDRIPPVLARTGRSFRMGRFETAVLLQLPAAAPYIFTGLKLVLGYGMAGIIGSEFILSNSGIGYSIAFAYDGFESEKMYALLLFVIILVTILLTAVNTFEKRSQFIAGAAWTVATAKRVTIAGGPLTKITDGIAVTIGFFAIWQVLHWLVGSAALTSPVETWQRAEVLFATARFWEHAEETMSALGVALIIAIFGGGLIGMILGFSRRAGEIFAPMFVALQSTPKVTLYPVMLLFFGLGFAAKVAFGAIHGIIPMTLITYNAVRTINPALLRTSKALRLNIRQTFLLIYIPATIPELVTAIRLSFSITFLGVMIGEMFASVRGLGHLIMGGIETNDVSMMISITVLIGLFAITINGFLLWLDNRLHRR